MIIRLAVFGIGFLIGYTLCYILTDLYLKKTFGDIYE